MGAAIHRGRTGAEYSFRFVCSLAGGGAPESGRKRKSPTGLAGIISRAVISLSKNDKTILGLCLIWSWMVKNRDELRLILNNYFIGYQGYICKNLSRDFLWNELKFSPKILF